jgi:hypothetical protein
MNYIIRSRSERLIDPLLAFFSLDENIQVIIDIIIYKSKDMPLRLLDWFVTNYSKKNDVSYYIKRPNNRIEYFNVFRSYRAQLKGSKKREFDPFCRGETMLLEYKKRNKIIFIETAICQLKFFKWMIENLIFDYIKTNLDDIYSDMKKNNHKYNNDITKKNILSSSIFDKIHISNIDVPVKICSNFTK